jgi:pyrimidine-specific ribonucleoside hydrolase
VLALALLLAACASSTPASPSGTVGPSASSSGTPAGPIPLVIDTDVGSDDVMAIAYLTTRSDYEIRAITVVGTGLVHCGPGERNVRNLLNELNAPIVPIACGPEEPLAGGLEFPEDWRAGADGRFGLTLVGIPGTPQGYAPDILAEAITGSASPVTLLTLGPLTNVAEAIAADSTLASHVSRIVMMGGAVDVPGNATSDGSPAPAEWNFAADPAAAAAVLAAGIPITLVPIDATNDVPVTRSFVDRLHEDVSAGPANLVDELLARNSFMVGLDSFWDQLTAVALVDPSVVTLEQAPIAVEVDGAEAGRTKRASDGAPVTVASGADATAFEAAFLDGLRSGGPRRSTFERVGTIAIVFDGTTCAHDAAARITAGVYELEFRNDADVEAAGVLAELVEGATFEQLDDWLAQHPDSVDQPPMIDVPGVVATVPHSTVSGLADLRPGDAFAACLYLGAEAQHAVRAPTPFVVE